MDFFDVHVNPNSLKTWKVKSSTVNLTFEPYFTTKANGTGLGMTMVYKIVKEFSGDIQVESEEGKGTIFTMVFPLQQDGKLAIES